MDHQIRYIEGMAVSWDGRPLTPVQENLLHLRLQTEYLENISVKLSSIVVLLLLIVGAGVVFAVVAM